MQRQLWWSAALVLLVAVAWTAFMGYVNTRTTALTVQVAAGLDDVSFFKTTDPQHAVAQIAAGGAAQQQTLTLRNSAGYSFLVQMPAAEYYFVVRQGGATYQSPVICCGIGAGSRRQSLVIAGLNEWQTTAP